MTFIICLTSGKQNFDVTMSRSNCSQFSELTAWRNILHLRTSEWPDIMKDTFFCYIYFLHSGGVGKFLCSGTFIRVGLRIDPDVSKGRSAFIFRFLMLLEPIRKWNAWVRRFFPCWTIIYIFFVDFFYFDMIVCSDICPKIDLMSWISPYILEYAVGVNYE